MQRAIKYLEMCKAEAEQNAELFSVFGTENESVWARDADAYDIAIRALQKSPERHDTASTPMAAILADMFLQLKKEGMEEKVAIKICGEALGKTVGRIVNAD